MDRPKPSEFDQELLDLYNDYAHGRVDRRGFLQRASKHAVGGLTAAAILEALSPNYAFAQQVDPADVRIETAYAEYESPKGGGTMRGLLARPAGKEGALPGVLVVHENRGLNPYIEDVVRRLAVEGFLAFGPDALTPLGGYPGNDDEGREMQATRDPDEMIEDFVAAAEWLHGREDTAGGIGVVGFCYGGYLSHLLAVRLPEQIAAAVPFYGRQAEPEEVSAIRAPLLIQFAENDPRVNEGWARLRGRPQGARGRLRGPLLPRHQPRLPQRHHPALRRGGGQARLVEDGRVLQGAPRGGLSRRRWVTAHPSRQAAQRDASPYPRVFHWEPVPI